MKLLGQAGQADREGQTGQVDQQANRLSGQACRANIMCSLVIKQSNNVGVKIALLYNIFLSSPQETAS